MFDQSMGEANEQSALGQEDRAEAGEKKNRKDIWKIAALWATWLVLLMLFSYFINSIVVQEKDSFTSSLFHWDAIWYQNIAQHGYFSLQSTAFFPLYPLLVRALSYPFLGNYRAAALTVSWISLLFALIYLFRLATLYEDEESALRTCLYLLVFPMALILAVGYTESLFLLCAVASFYHARQSGWILAGAWACAACLARSTGIVVCAAIVLEALRQSGWKFKRLRPRMAGVLLGPLGLAAYMVYLKIDFGNFMAFSEAQKVPIWDRGFSPLLIFRAAWNMLSTGQFMSVRFLFILMALLFLVLAAIVFVRYGAPLGTLSLLLVAIPLLMGSKYDPTASLARYVMVVFPVFILMGRWGRSRIFALAYVTASTFGLIFFIVCYFNHVFHF